MKTEKEKKKDIKLFKEVSWLYDRLDKKEFDILKKWVFANCEITREEGYDAGKSETIKQIDILYNKIKGEYNEEHKIMMEVKGKDNARYYRQYAVCGQLAYGMVKLEELKEILEGELAK